MARRLGLALALVLAGSALAPAASRAGCCQLVKSDPESASTTVRACEPDANEGCAAVLFEGTLALGQSQAVCAEGPTLVYQEQDPATGTYGAYVGALCDEASGDVGI